MADELSEAVAVAGKIVETAVQVTGKAAEMATAAAKGQLADRQGDAAVGAVDKQADRLGVRAGTPELGDKAPLPQMAQNEAWPAGSPETGSPIFDHLANKASGTSGTGANDIGRTGQRQTDGR